MIKAATRAGGAFGAIPAAAVFVPNAVPDGEKEQYGYNSQNNEICNIHNNLLLYCFSLKRDKICEEMLAPAADKKSAAKMSVFRWDNRISV